MSDTITVTKAALRSQVEGKEEVTAEGETIGRCLMRQSPVPLLR